VRDENDQVVFRTLTAPKNVKSKVDLQKHLPKDFPMDLIEETNGKVQSKFSRESDHHDDDSKAAERLLRSLNIEDIDFGDRDGPNGNDDDDDGFDNFDFDNVDDVVDFTDLQREENELQANSRNNRLMNSIGGSNNDYAYEQ
jgi:hypothetical protein